MRFCSRHLPKRFARQPSWSTCSRRLLHSEQCSLFLRRLRMTPVTGCFHSHSAHSCQPLPAGGRGSGDVHPAPDGELRDQLNHHIIVSKAVCRLAAKLLPKWPRLDLTGVTLTKKGGKKAGPTASTLQHEWEWCRSYWRCGVCLRVRRKEDPVFGAGGAVIASRPSPEGCSGTAPDEIRNVSAHGHRLISFQCSDDSPLFMCVTCKAISTLGPLALLSNQCARPTRNILERWRYRVCRGRHPKRDGVYLELSPENDFEMPDPPQGPPGG